MTWFRYVFNKFNVHYIRASPSTWCKDSWSALLRCWRNVLVRYTTCRPIVLNKVLEVHQTIQLSGDILENVWGIFRLCYPSAGYMFEAYLRVNNFLTIITVSDPLLYWHHRKLEWLQPQKKNKRDSEFEI